MAVIAQPQLREHVRNGVDVAFALYYCGCGCRITFPDEGPRACPLHGEDRMGWTIYPKGHPRGPW